MKFVHLCLVVMVGLAFVGLSMAMPDPYALADPEADPHRGYGGFGGFGGGGFGGGFRPGGFGGGFRPGGFGGGFRPGGFGGGFHRPYGHFG
ncbi:H/ACA ribonucleoprotein complex subunit 1-like [Palaemon carinicauda]|uniref:H/ACA ribonucleoprotein complex subunit 1-like n=1 Tax=Palaemon carinicauda TaxID=392227 RepID=UPI0035B58B0E